MLIICGCRFGVGVPTDQELQQMQAWAEVVTPKDRAEVMRQANEHTEWAERRKVQFITGEYKKRYLHEQGEAGRSIGDDAEHDDHRAGDDAHRLVIKSSPLVGKPAEPFRNSARAAATSSFGSAMPSR